MATATPTYAPPPAMPGVEHYLETLEHEEVLIRRGARSGLFTFVAVHSTVRGPALGGCRMWVYDDPRAALRDVLRLSRAMTFKAAVANLPLGGGKGVICIPTGTRLSRERRQAALLDFGDTVAAAQGHYVTAEDVGTSSRDMTVIAQRTDHVAGLARSQGGSGDPSPSTALGVVAGIRAACEHAFGTLSLAERSVAVVGLGHVGSRVAKLCARDGARLVVSDVDESKRAVADELGAEWLEPDDALLSDVDVVAPCALGGVLNDVTVPRLRCRVIAGAANNQLADERIADALAARDILWAPDFVVNAGGIINIVEELHPGQAYDPATARRKVKAIADTLRQIFADAQATASTPLAAAMELARRRLAPA